MRASYILCGLCENKDRLGSGDSFLNVVHMHHPFLKHVYPQWIVYDYKVIECMERPLNVHLDVPRDSFSLHDINKCTYLRYLINF